MSTELHRLPADDDQVADLTADIIEGLTRWLGETAIAESSETGECLVTQTHRGHARRFRIKLIEILP